MISSKNKHVIIPELSDITFQMIFDVWWASMNVSLKCPFVWNISTHASSWLLYLHAGWRRQPAIALYILFDIVTAACDPGPGNGHSIYSPCYEPYISSDNLT